MIKLIFQGMVVGVANIIPGVSGGTMLVAMGLYDRLIHAVAHIRTETVKSLRLLIPILGGAGVAVVLLSRLFEYLLTVHPIPTNFAFCGLIIGSIPFIWKRLPKETLFGEKGNTAAKGGWGTLLSGVCAFCLFFAVVLVMALMEETADTGAALTPGAVTALVLFLVGLVAAATMVIPGVSGSMVLMLLGYYYPVLHLVNTLTGALAAGDVYHIGMCLLLLVPFGIGVLAGVVLIARLIEWLMERFAFASYMAILGLICSSPVAILLRTNWSRPGAVTILLSVAALALGIFVSGKFGGDEKSTSATFV